MEINTVYINEENYPLMLNGIADPPNPIYYIGDISLASKRCVAIVGSRKSTDYGQWAAFKLAERLGECGVPVVSGMAQGVDSFAHKGALKAGGKTIAVLGCGIDICYPASSKRLRDEIMKEGLVLSEYGEGVPPARYTFPKRNRIISGICETVVVTQAGNQSGALITAEIAADQGRNVYSVPGNINNIYNLGNNKLLRDGAIPLVVLEDLLADMGIQSHKIQEVEKNLGKDEKNIYKLLAKGGEMTVDQLCSETGVPVGVVNGLVTILEMKGLVLTSLGKVFIAKS
ncbi:MAG: DNA-processing protein DprA [Anaerovoracaceae bacterium]